MLGISDVDFQEAFSNTLVTLMPANLQAQFYKTCFELYYTPYRIAKWGERKGVFCPRCAVYKADLMHMLATCSELGPLIREIEVFLQEKLLLQVKVTPQVILLGIANLEKKEGGAFICIAMAVYRICIAAAWFDATPPVFHQWLARLLSTYNLEKAIYKRRGYNAKKKGVEIWQYFANWRDQLDG